MTPRLVLLLALAVVLVGCDGYFGGSPVRCVVWPDAEVPCDVDASADAQ